MQKTPIVKVTIVKKRRRSSQRSIKSTSSSVKVTRVKSTKKSENTLVVENVDTISTAPDDSVSQSSKNITNKPTENVSPLQFSYGSNLQSINPSSHLSTTYTVKSKQKDPFNSSATTQFYDSSFMSLSKSQDRRINSSSSKFSVGIRRDLYTIGKDVVNKNKKNQFVQKCPVRYYVAYGLILFLIVGLIIALPAIVVSSMMTTMKSTISTTVTMSTLTSTSVSTVTTTSVTTATPAATVTITSNTCTSSWSGITLKHHCDNCAQQSTYALLQFSYAAIANLTRITFVLRRDSGYFGIDDVSIQDTAALGIELLSDGGCETGTFSSWIHCIQSGSTATGSVQSTASGISYGAYNFTALLGSYYYLGGATVNAEYLSQTFSSIIGNTYIFSFSYIYVGSGSLSSSDFLLST